MLANRGTWHLRWARSAPSDFPRHGPSRDTAALMADSKPIGVLVVDDALQAQFAVLHGRHRS
jgi:hypothetical protein